MIKDNSNTLTKTELSVLSLDEIARVGAQELLRQALEAEISVYLEKLSGKKRDDGTAGIVRNGYHRSRKVTVGSGTIDVAVPRTRNRSGGRETSPVQLYPSICAAVSKLMRQSLSLSQGDLHGQHGRGAYTAVGE
ncbi:transposase [Chitinivibrio alkaliphilus]|uniref:Transposase, mutator type n=1 Tax=Chitinivibrio alkaliphilus ACht1 TaxID=1313304 RepID=U7D2C9_9BACT|nr:transposase [Chitinivibrio alkaliphilus]ERP30659.1 transposase, mutator type [Chitinivibrio alkaliphilus ACht1]